MDDDRIICRIDPFTTHLHYRGEEVPLKDVLQALHMLPLLKQMATAMAAPKPAALPKPIKRKRNGYAKRKP